MKYWRGLFLLIMAAAGLACDSGGPDASQTVRKQMVLFASDRGGGGNMNIWMMTPEGGDLRQVTHYAEGDFWPADISPDGKRLLFYRWDDRSLVMAIYLMDLDGPQPAMEQMLLPGLAYGGSFFPDGERFLYTRHVFTSDTTGHDALFVYNPRDSTSVQMSPVETHNYDGRVSPDGSRICFSEIDLAAPGLPSQIFLMDADGSNRRVITSGQMAPYAQQCTFPPGGDRIFFSMTGDLHWRDLAAGETHRIEKNEYDAFPATDTSGTRLFFRQGGGARPDAESEIYVINLDGSGLTRLTNDGYRDDKPVVGVVEFLE